MEGRGAGTKGLDLARDFVVGQFETAGLEPGFHGGFTQPFEIMLGSDTKTQALAVNGRPADANALGFAANGRFDAEAVFVGYGIDQPKRNYNSYANDIVRGRVAVVMRYEPMDEQGVSLWTKAKEKWSSAASLTAKARWAAEHGAVAIIFINPPDRESPLRTARETSGFEAATIPVMHAATSALGDLDWARWQKAANRGELHPVLLPDTRLSGEVELIQRRVTVENVAGILPGRGDLKDEVVVIGAHYDHLGYGEFGSLSGGDVAIHAGADDNASGTAGVIMLADRFAKRTDPSRRTILFIAFSGEERGLLGSNWLLTHFDDARVVKSQLTAMINLDMVGRMQNNRIYVLGVGSGDGWKTAVAPAAKAVNFDLVTDASPLGASDHASFYTHQIPAIHLFTGAHEDYHRPSDTAEKINAAGGAAVVDFIERIAANIAIQPKRMKFDASGARDANHAMNFGGAYLGIVPDYATMSGNSGCGVSGLTPGGPAMHAGLEPGDMIVRWNGKKIGNVYDLSRTLGDASPNDAVVLEIKRSEKIIKLNVTLGKR